MSNLPPVPPPPIYPSANNTFPSSSIPNPPIQELLPIVPKPPSPPSATLPTVPKPFKQSDSLITNIPKPPEYPTTLPKTPSILSNDEDLPPSQRLLAQKEEPKQLLQTIEPQVDLIPELLPPITNIPKPTPLEKIEESTSPQQPTAASKPKMQGLIEDYSSKIVKKVDGKIVEEVEENNNGIIIQTAKEPDEYQQLIKKAESNGAPPDLLDRMENISKRMRVMENSGNIEIVDVERHYLETLAQLPWNQETEDIHDIKRAQQILDELQYGMQPIKNRVLEFLAVQQLTQNEATAPVLCFLGTPGVGKTTLSRAIAAALGRKFVRISLAAMSDVRQIKGTSHMRADAQPGQIIRQICKCGVRNPVILFDEFEKMGGGIEGGEMMSTFLEILDPEQNYAFVDHYIDYPYDLSHCIFLATANKVAEGAGPVINRMELITIPDYSRDEKKIIGQRYVLPRVLKSNGMTPEKGFKIEITDDGWNRLLDPFKWDSGMRTLTHQLNNIVTKMARDAVENGTREFTVTPENIRNYILV
ncbi:MAG: AAA family ATPase [bacterium]